MSQLVVQESIEEILAGCMAAAEKYAARTEEQKYDLLEAGLWLLKAQAFHATPKGKTRHASARTVTFEDWCASHFPGTPRQRIYEWCNLASNMDLTAASPLTEVARLRKENALHGRALKALYRPPIKLPPAPSPTPIAATGAHREIHRDPQEEAQQLLLPLFQSIGETVHAYEEQLRSLPYTSDAPGSPSLLSMKEQTEALLRKIKAAIKDREAAEA